MAALLLLAACGGDGESAGSTAATTSTTSSTTSTPATTSRVAMAAAPSTPATTASSGGCSTPTFDPSGELRDQFVGYLVACGFTAQEGDCIYERLDFSDPAVMAGDIEAILAAIEGCGITPERMEEIVQW
jgi:hypothetical protein